MTFRAEIYSTRELKPYQELHIRHLGLGNPVLVSKFALCEPRSHFGTSLPLVQEAPTEDRSGIFYDGPLLSRDISRRSGNFLNLNRL